LVKLAKQEGCSVTFHRAFDAVDNHLEALEMLIDLGVQRVLTSGTSWHSQQPVKKGLAQIQKMLSLADGRIELILAGGIQVSNVQNILQVLHLGRNTISIHAYSGVLVNGRTDQTAVAQLYNAISSDYQYNEIPIDIS
jgi:copper homeostasis protein